MKRSEIKDKLISLYYRKLRTPLIWTAIIFCCFEATVLTFSLISGDAYLFPMNLLAKNEVESNPEFQEYLKSHNMILKTLCWFTAKRKGAVWIFYIVVQDKPINTNNEVDAVANRWSYHSNGFVFYNTDTKQVIIDLIGYNQVKLGGS